jgi:hypothetical protein
VLVVGLVGACSGGAGMDDDATAGVDETAESSVDDDAGEAADAEGSSDGADESGDGDESSESGDGGPDPGEPWEPAPELPPLSDEAVAQLQQAIDGVLADPAVSGAAHGVLVVDGEIGQELYARNAEVVRAPASNTKLFTTAAAFDLLGADHRSETTLWSTDAGDVVMVGRHDPSWSGFSYEGSRVALDRIAEDVQRAGVTSIGTVVASGEYLYQGDNFSYYDAELHRGRALTSFRDALSAVGIASLGGQTSASFDPPPGAALIGTWRSPPLDVTSVPLNVESHNEYAASRSEARATRPSAARRSWSSSPPSAPTRPASRCTTAPGSRTTTASARATSSTCSRSRSKGTGASRGCARSRSRACEARSAVA